MRKIIVQEMVTVDGFFAGPKGEIDWHNVDAEFNEYALENLGHIDTLMFGRMTYDLMASYWPTEGALTDDPLVAERMNSLPKIVFSKTMDKLDWNNSTVLKTIDAEEIRKIKEAPGKDIAIFGSGVLVEQLTELGLIDEYRLIVNPVILGQGRTIFAGLKERKNVEFLSSRSFASGNIMLCYAPVGNHIDE